MHRDLQLFSDLDELALYHNFFSSLFCLFWICINVSVLNIIWLMSSYCIFILLLKNLRVYFLKCSQSSEHIKTCAELPTTQARSKILSSKYLPCLLLRCCFHSSLSCCVCLVTHGSLNVAYRTFQKIYRMFSHRNFTWTSFLLLSRVPNLCNASCLCDKQFLGFYGPWGFYNFSLHLSEALFFKKDIFFVSQS